MFYQCGRVLHTAFERLEPDEGKLSRPVVCPAKAGVFSRKETYQGKSQSPVARRAGGRATNLLKPLDSLIRGMRASLQAVAHANAAVAPPVSSPGGRACNRAGEGSMGSRRLADTAHPLRRGGSDSMETRTREA